DHGNKRGPAWASPGWTRLAGDDPATIEQVPPTCRSPPAWRGNVQGLRLLTTAHSSIVRPWARLHAPCSAGPAPCSTVIASWTLTCPRPAHGHRLAYAPGKPRQCRRSQAREFLVRASRVLVRRRCRVSSVLA